MFVGELSLVTAGGAPLGDDKGDLLELGRTVQLWSAWIIALGAA